MSNEVLFLEIQFDISVPADLDNAVYYFTLTVYINSLHQQFASTVCINCYIKRTYLEKVLRIAFVRLGVFVNEIALPTRFVVFFAFLLGGKGTPI